MYLHSPGQPIFSGKNASRRKFLTLLGSFSGLVSSFLSAQQNPIITIDNPTNGGNLPTGSKRSIVRENGGNPLANIFTVEPEAGVFVAKRGDSEFFTVFKAPGVNGVNYDVLPRIYNKFRRKIILAVPGAMIDTKGDTQGVVIIEGKKYSSVPTPERSGFLLIHNGRPKIVFPEKVEEFSREQEHAKNTVIQTYTALRDGKNTGMKAPPSKFRFFAERNDGNNVFIIFSKKMNYTEAMQILLDPKLNIRHALYLDTGGLEKGQFWDNNGKAFDLGETTNGSYDNLIILHGK